MIAVLRLQARRDRLPTTLWVLGVVLIGVGSASAVGSEYGGTASRAAILRVALVTPALVALRGVPNGTSLGSLTWFQVYAFLAVAVGLLNTFLAVRHGRGDEERGRRELLAAAPLARTTPLVATALLGIGVNVVLGVLAGAGFAASGLPAAGAVVAGAALTATGLAFLGLGLLIGELAPTSRSANGIGAAVVLGAYALRGAGDALGTPDFRRLTLTAAWPSWISPIGWGEQTLAFTGNRLAPLLLSIALFAVCTGAALAVRARRDLGWALLPERRGPATAGVLLAGPAGLAWRSQRLAALAWAVGAALLGAVIGPLGDAVTGAVRGDSQVRPILASLGRAEGDVITIFVTAVLGMVGIMAAAAAVQASLHLREEESSGRAEAVLSAPVGRARWVLASVAAGWATAALVLALAAVTTWAGLLAVDPQGAAARSLAQSALQLPAALVFAGLAALLVAALPRASVTLTWLLFAAAVVIGLLGGLFDLPDPVRNTSPFSDVPVAPVSDWTGTVVLAAVAVLLPSLAALTARARDVQP